MSTESINGRLLRAAIIAGANALNKNKNIIDAMNVFPVPDGDTGTNMYLTALSAAVEAEKQPRDASVYAVAKAAAAGALRGARGNSGVILSQLFRGFAKGLEGLQTAGAEELANSLSQAVETAFRAIMKPKEGTILTVAREVAEKALEESIDAVSVKDFFNEILKHGNEVLAKTKDMLPVLKAANVPDAGGKGFMVILEGAYAALNGKNRESAGLLVTPDKQEDSSKKNPEAIKSVGSDIRFAYCTELFIYTDKSSEHESKLLKFLDTIGDSIVVVSDEELIKVHVHTNNPGLVLEKAVLIGHIDGVKIENMRIQHTEKISWEDAQDITLDNISYETYGSVGAPDEKSIGFIAVASGEGFSEIFKSLGADYIIEGGQTMNPSSQQFLSAIESLNQNSIIILPNNKNVIMAAQQAAELTKGKEVYVVPTKSVPQGLAAIVGYAISETAAENALKMESSIKGVKTGQITKAVRNTTVNELDITEGDFLAILDGDIILKEQSQEDAAIKLSDKLIDEDTVFVSIYYGEGASEEEAVFIMQHINGHFPECECEVRFGGQAVYSYVISAE